MVVFLKQVASMDQYLMKGNQFVLVIMVICTDTFILSKIKKTQLYPHPIQRNTSPTKSFSSRVFVNNLWFISTYFKYTPFLFPG